MKKNNKWLVAAYAIAMLSIVFFACKKDNSTDTDVPSGQSKVSIFLMDGPLPFTKVLIDIKQIAVKIDTAARVKDDDNGNEWDDEYKGCKKSKSVIWDTLKITPGVHDLLALRNGTDTLLVSDFIPKGKIIKLRITLGTNNTVYTDSVTKYPLNIFGPFSSFEVNVRKENVSVINNNQFKLWLDFDLSKSILSINNKYMLVPYFKLFNDMEKSKLEGKVLPENASALVTIFNKKDTAYALPWKHDGYYKVRGLDTGTYSIFFKGQKGYKDTTINNIQVKAKGVTKVPTITLHK